MRPLLLIVVVLLLGAGLYALTTIGVGGLLGAGRAKSDTPDGTSSNQDEANRVTDLNRRKAD